MRFNFCYALCSLRETSTVGSQKASGNQASSYPLIYSSMEEQQYHTADFEQDPVIISDQRTISLAYAIP
jgi:hypothetical protein